MIAALRRSLGALTLRGLCFLAAGLTALVGGVLVGEPDYVVIGTLLATLTVASAIWYAGRRPDLSLTRSPQLVRVEAGQSALISLAITAHGRSTPLLLGEDQVGAALGQPTRFTVGPLSAGETWRGHNEVAPTRRGRYQVGPLRLKVRDPFGFTETVHAFTGTTTVVVTPPIRPLPPILLPGRHHSGDGSGTGSGALGSLTDASVREYQTGDEIRRIHWRTSARVGDLMVRREDNSPDRSCTLVVDDRADAYVTGGGDARAALDAAATAAASIAADLIDRGHSVRYLARVAPDLPPTRHSVDPAADREALLDEFADLSPSDATTPPWTGDDPGAPEQPVIAVVGPYRDLDLPGSGPVVVLVVGDGSDPKTETLVPTAGRELRWSVWAPGEDLSVAWQRLGR